MNLGARSESIRVWHHDGVPEKKKQVPQDTSPYITIRNSVQYTAREHVRVLLWSARVNPLRIKLAVRFSLQRSKRADS